MLNNIPIEIIRVFVDENGKNGNPLGIPEDEANGSGAMKLTFLLKKDLTIIHGVGSVIYTKYIDGNDVSVGGGCIG